MPERGIEEVVEREVMDFTELSKAEAESVTGGGQPVVAS